jgi:MoaA/NifB/PqqE/SkfB family radical SAM enzyme
LLLGYVTTGKTKLEDITEMTEIINKKTEPYYKFLKTNFNDLEAIDLIKKLYGNEVNISMTSSYLIK